VVLIIGPEILTGSRVRGLTNRSIAGDLPAGIQTGAGSQTITGESGQRQRRSVETFRSSARQSPTPDIAYLLNSRVISSIPLTVRGNIRPSIISLIIVIDRTCPQLCFGVGFNHAARR
jgi:hypothetical protein